MPARVPWFERTFPFDFPVDIFPEVIERLRGTPARIEHLTRGVSAETLTRRDGETWSIQENVGHLADLEDLFTARLDDFEAGAPTLRAADVTNSRTHAAGHNERSFASALDGFASKRGAMVARLDAKPDEFFAHVALHPRLNKPMRAVDSITFAAEHDDYHLARIRELLRRFTGR